VEASADLRQLRYFVAVAEELHFGRAAERLHMSQSPLSRAIRDLERQLGLVLFVRTTRRVELTPAGRALLVGARRTLTEFDVAIADARDAAEPDARALSLGYGPFNRAVAVLIARNLTDRAHPLAVRLDEDVTPELLRRVAAHDLSAALVMESPGAARQYRLRIDTLRDEQLLAALPASHAYAGSESIPVGAFVAELVMLPREPAGQMYNAWFRALLRTAGFELGRTIMTLSAPWDRRMLPVANGEAVSVFVGEWAAGAEGVAAVPFDPPLSFPMDLASPYPSTEPVEELVKTGLQLRDAGGWLTRRESRVDLPPD
jgi:DNA-binding transcriptional LysR family regulator